MAWKNLKDEIAEEFGRFGDAERVTKAGLMKLAGSLQHKREAEDRDRAIPETPEQRLQRRRKERAARVAGLVRGQKVTGQQANAAYQRKHMEHAYAGGLPRSVDGSKHSNPNLDGRGPRRCFVPTKAQAKLIADRSMSAEVLAVLLGVSRVTAFRLRRKALTGKAR